jgi:hypothetical protein
LDGHIARSRGDNAINGATVIHFSRIFVKLTVVLAMAWGLAQAAPAPGAARKIPDGIRADGSLDRDRVHNLYMEGEFDKVQEALEHYRHSVDSLAGADRIFVYKYLGVIYSARPETRVKGEGYLYSLLHLVPTITLLDMYISDAVESIFKGVKERYQTVAMERRSAEAGEAAAPMESGPAQAAKPAGAAPSGKPAAREASSRRSGPSKWPYIAAAGAATAGAVVAFVLLSGSEPEKEEYVLRRP